MPLSDAKTKKAEEFLTDFLIKTYPKCFNLNNKIPLKVGIYKEVLLNHQEEANKRLIKNALSVYCHAIDYLESFSKYNYRVDLNGEKSGNLEESAIEDSLNRINNKQKSEERDLVNSDRIKKGLPRIKKFNNIDEIIKEETESFKKESKALRKEVKKLKLESNKFRKESEKLKKEVRKLKQISEKLRREAEKPKKAPVKPKKTLVKITNKRPTLSLKRN